MFLLKIDVISLPGQIAANQLCGNHVSTWWCVFCCSPRWYLVVMDVRSPGKKNTTHWGIPNVQVHLEIQYC